MGAEAKASKGPAVTEQRLVPEVRTPEHGAGSGTAVKMTSDALSAKNGETKQRK